MVGDRLGDDLGDGRCGIGIWVDAIHRVRTGRTHETPLVVRAGLHCGAGGAIESAPDVDDTVRAGILGDLPLQHREDFVDGVEAHVVRQAHARIAGGSGEAALGDAGRWEYYEYFRLRRQCLEQLDHSHVIRSELGPRAGGKAVDWTVPVAPLGIVGAKHDRDDIGIAVEGCLELRAPPVRTVAGARRRGIIFPEQTRPAPRSPRAICTKSVYEHRMARRPTVRDVVSWTRRVLGRGFCVFCVNVVCASVSPLCMCCMSMFSARTCHHLRWWSHTAQNLPQQLAKHWRVAARAASDSDAVTHTANRHRTCHGHGSFRVLKAAN